MRKLQEKEEKKKRERGRAGGNAAELGQQHRPQPLLPTSRTGTQDRTPLRALGYLPARHEAPDSSLASAGHRDVLSQCRRSKVQMLEERAENKIL